MFTDWSNQIILGRFRVDLRIPGEVECYRAWDTLTNQAVTLHLLAEAPDDESRRKIEDNARDLERLSIAGVLPYLGLFESAQRIFWAESHLDGPSLRDVLDSMPGASLPLNEALVYLKNVTGQVAALHALGWCHANLRPENIRVGRDGRIALSGLFWATRLGELPPLGTLYTPPDKILSPASDVFALACILYEMLAAALPNERVDLRKLNPDVPEFLARLLPRALDQNPSMRMASVNEFFLTLCMASQVEPASIPERIGGSDGSPAGISPSAAVLGQWDFLPPIEHPRPINRNPLSERKRSIAWIWPVVAAAGIGVAALGWYLLRPVNPAREQGTPLAVENPTSTAIPATLAPILAPTDTLVPTLEAPDGLGGRIVFTCTRAELNHLCLIPPTGGSVFQLTAEMAHDYYPSFSPDGNIVLYASNRAGMFNLFLKLISSGILVQLTDDIGEVSSASFSPDGSQVVFSNSVGGAPSGLWLVDKDGKNPQMIYDGTGNIASPVFAPNGKSVAFAMSSPEALETYDVYIWDFETQTVGAVTKGRLPDAGGSVDWSPDGRALLLFAGTSGDHDIFTFDIVSGEIRQLTDGGNNAAPAWSPDGRWIVFNSQRVNDTANIFIVRPDGSDVRQLTNDTEPDWQPRWGK
ncbi:MAG: hypothetical protein EHM81_05420 [Chloroflexi bacterium]|nr:MAG: hypothetical protein EHM81_05420 [Chloroflexota bacterium]